MVKQLEAPSPPEEELLLLIRTTPRNCCWIEIFIQLVLQTPRTSYPFLLLSGFFLFLFFGERICMQRQLFSSYKDTERERERERERGREIILLVHAINRQKR